MRRVEQAQLDLLIRCDVTGELHADILERGPAVTEPVLDNPLDEVLAEKRPGIVDARRAVQAVRVVRRDRGGDAVDHAARKIDLVLDPVRQARVEAAREVGEGIPGDGAVVLEVVAREDGERRHAVSPALGERRGDEAEHARGCPRVGKVVRDRRRVEAVAALGDGHRHDPDARIGEAADGGLPIVRRVAVIDDRAHDKPVGFAFGRALRQRVESVLAREQGGLGPLARVVDDPDAEDAPIGLAAMQAAIEVERHVGAVEIADTEMGDARCDAAPIVGRHGDASWQTGQGGVGQRGHRSSRGRPGSIVPIPA